MRTPPLQRFLIIQFLRIPRPGPAILGMWAILGLVAYIPGIEIVIPPVALLIAWAPIGLLFMFAVVCMAEGIVRMLLSPFVRFARRLNRHG